ncbi:MAG TPA: response regulator [Bacteroidia bacterium]|nr:response regulator [Bacteroidia bacterium]
MEDKVNILLIEDNPSDKELVSIYLRDVYAGRSILFTAESLAKGLHVIEGNPIDVIILDLSLPDSWGLETFNKLHTEVPWIPIIVLTGLEDEKIGTDAVKMGAQDFLIKGKVKGKSFQRSISYSIERHKLLKALSAKAEELEEKTNVIQQEKQKLALAHKIAKIGSWEWDLVTGNISWSDELFDLHDMEHANKPFTFDEMLAHIHPDDRMGILDVLEKSKETPKPVSFYYRIIRNDGSIRTFFSLGEVMVNAEGKPVKVIGTRQDVTERMQEEEMQKLAMAATKSFNSVIIAERNGSIEWVNEGFTKLTGYTLADVKNTNGEILRRGEATGISQDAEHYNKVIKRKIPVTYESKNYAKDGKEYWTITTLTPVLDSTGKVGRIIAIDTDITQRKQMEEDLRRANNVADDLLDKTNRVIQDLKFAKKELEETMQVKEQFLANMSHEIRTPMNAIIGFTREMNKTNLTDQQKQYIDIIKSSGNNLLVIVNDILDFSKLRSGKINFEQIEFSLHETISSITELLLPKTHEKGLELITDIDDQINDNLVGDPTRLNQILTNLLSNAIKFTKEGEVKIRIDIVSQDAQKIELKFSVIDSGIGIPEEKLPTIFDAFTQASPETTRKFGGTGLGLAIVKQLVEHQGGEITVNSKPGKGSVFGFTLSFSKGTGHVKERKVDLTNELSKVMPPEGFKVLLVEDNELNAVLAEKVLSDWNWKVDVAKDGFIALEKIKQKNFDLVLMDIQLPGMDGYETTQKMRQEFPGKHIPIIAMTAHALAGEREKCLEAGMDEYVSKPFEPENLYMKILTAMHIKNWPEDGNHKMPLVENPPVARHTDLTYLEGIAKGSKGFIIQMLNIFIEQTPNALDHMDKALKNKDWKSLRLIVHKIKPSIMFTGLTEIINDVPLLEDYAAEESHLDKIPALLEKTKKVCSEAIVELKEELKKLNDA